MKKFLTVFLLVAAMLMVSCKNNAEEKKLNWTWVCSIASIECSKIEIDGSNATFYSISIDLSTWEKDGEAIIKLKGKDITFTKDGEEGKAVLADDNKSFTLITNNIPLTYVKKE